MLYQTLRCPVYIESTLLKSNTVYAIYFAGVLFSRISRVGCYSRIQQHAKINLPPIPTQECDLCIRNTSSTVHSARANEWMILISLTYVHDCSPPRSQISPLAEMS